VIVLRAKLFFSKPGIPGSNLMFLSPHTGRYYPNFFRSLILYQLKYDSGFGMVVTCSMLKSWIPFRGFRYTIRCIFL
jgi:hypothetical protein